MHITVGDLRRAIQGLPDNSPILGIPHKAETRKGWDDKSCEFVTAVQKSDDRFSQKVLVMELAEPGDYTLASDSKSESRSEERRREAQG